MSRPAPSTTLQRRRFLQTGLAGSATHAFGGPEQLAPLLRPRGHMR